jgi:hypothetical protein
MKRIVLVSLAAAAALAPLPPRVVEHVYSSGVYPAWQPMATRVSNLTPFALFDIFVAATTILWIGAAVRDAAGGSWLRAAGRLVTRTIVWAAGLYLLFLAAWGLNYRRVRLVDTVEFDAAAVSPERAVDLAAATAAHLNVLYAGAHGRAAAPVAPDGDSVDPVLAAAFSRVLDDLGRPAVFVPARPKSTLFNAYFRRAGVDGMTDPYFLETLVAGGLLPIERPFVIAHEWSHLAGIADEGEANFVGWLTCLRAGPADQYSGAIFLYSEVSRSVQGQARGLVRTRLDAGPLEDLRAIARRQTQEIDPRVAQAGWRVYDRYLKANRVERGTASYAEIVRLVLGVRMSPDGVPLLKPAS